MPWEVGVHSAQMTVGCAKLNLKIKQDSNQNRDHQVSSLNYSPSSDFFVLSYMIQRQCINGVEYVEKYEYSNTNVYLV